MAEEYSNNNNRPNPDVPEEISENTISSDVSIVNESYFYNTNDETIQLRKTVVSNKTVNARLNKNFDELIQVEKEIDVLEKMVDKIACDYEELINIIHQEKYDEPMVFVESRGSMKVSEDDLRNLITEVLKERLR